MPFYIKRPIPIEAHQIIIEHINELAEWYNCDITYNPDGSISGMRVLTLEGTMTSSLGNYIIKGVRGEVYFCDKDIFEETYYLSDYLSDQII